MNCDDCFEAQNVDGIVPPCQTEEGCWIPAPLPSVSRALEIRDRLSRLKKLNIGSEVLRIYGATRFDLTLIAEAEDTLNAPAPDDPGPEGSEEDC